MDDQLPRAEQTAKDSGFFEVSWSAIEYVGCRLLLPIHHRTNYAKTDRSGG